MTFPTDAITTAMTAIGAAIAVVGAGYVLLPLGAKAWKIIARAF